MRAHIVASVTVALNGTGKTNIKAINHIFDTFSTRRIPFIALSLAKLIQCTLYMGYIVIQIRKKTRNDTGKMPF